MPDDLQRMTYDLQDLSILLVDDQEDVRRGLKRLIGSLGCQVQTSASGEEALALLRKEDFDIVFTDIRMEGISGVELLEIIKHNWADIEVVMITGHGTIELAVSCLQNGASHFITKPFNNNEILSFIERAGFKILSARHARRFSNKYDSRTIIAVDKSIRRVLELVERVAPSKVPVLIEGPSGTGKELIAREIHNRSLVRNEPFVAINCIALPDTLLESELFGYTKGAFTGAYKATSGLFEQVNGGTLFLDEVASMSPLFQGKLLRVLQEKTVRPLGSRESIKVNFRLVSASNRNLEEMVRRGEFREDLFYRLQVVRISLPPLKERKACIPALAQYFLKQAAMEFPGGEERLPELSQAAITVLMNYDWPGNVRELENTIQRAMIVHTGDKILPSHLGLGGDLNLGSEAFTETSTYEEGKRQAIENFQRVFLQNALQRTNGNISRAAELCGLTRAALQRIMRKLDIDRESMVKNKNAPISS